MSKSQRSGQARADRDHRLVDEPEAIFRPAVLVELIATAALALCTLIAATAVSIGIARADLTGAARHVSSSPGAQSTGHCPCHSPVMMGS